MDSLKIYENTLPKLGFKIDSWRKKTVCICLSTTVRKNHTAPSDIPLFPFPVRPEKQILKSQSEGLQADLELDNISCTSADTVFGIKPGAFYDTIMPETVQSLWGPVPLDTLPDGVDNTCRAVTHDIVNGMESKMMSVYLIHSLPLVLSAVQVYVGSEMAVVAHTVGPDTVGPLAETLVDGESFEDTFWRGMMIKDNAGDWGLCIAGWKGVRRGIPGVAGTSSRKGTPGRAGDHGYFLMHFFNLRTGGVKQVKVSSRAYKHLVDLDEVVMDWDSGNILVRKRSGDIAQLMCLAFVTSTLYLLVQPRPEDIDEAETQWTKHKTNSRLPESSLRTPPFIRNAALLMLLYSGWRECKRIPSNSTVAYETRRYRSGAGYRDDNTDYSPAPYMLWAAGCWGGLGYHDHGLYDDSVFGDQGFSDMFAEGVGVGDADVGGDVFGGCGGCGGCGGGFGDGGASGG